MNDDFQELIDGYLDERLVPAEALRLSIMLKENPAYSRRFARVMLLHDRLYNELKIRTLPDQQRVELRPRRRALTAVAAVVALFLIAFFFWHGAAVSHASAAVVALDRLIEAASQPVDRVYRIRVIDHGPSGAAPPVFSGSGRKPGIDGSELFVRGSDKFVLVRLFGNGTKFVTGSDGEFGWAVPPKGPIHVSHDTRRFRRAVPGEHKEIPFLDLKTGLSELRRAYDLQLMVGHDADSQMHGWSRLAAMKRSPERTGPERVQVWFDAAGVAHRIELTGMPQDHGGPRGVVLELIEQRDVGPNFSSTRPITTRAVAWIGNNATALSTKLDKRRLSHETPETATAPRLGVCVAPGHLGVRRDRSATTAKRRWNP